MRNACPNQGPCPHQWKALMTASCHRPATRPAPEMKNCYLHCLVRRGPFGGGGGLLIWAHLSAALYSSILNDFPVRFRLLWLLHSGFLHLPVCFLLFYFTTTCGDTLLMSEALVSHTFRVSWAVFHLEIWVSVCLFHTTRGILRTLFDAAFYCICVAKSDSLRLMISLLLSGLLLPGSCLYRIRRRNSLGVSQNVSLWEKLRH